MRRIWYIFNTKLALKILVYQFKIRQLDPSAFQLSCTGKIEALTGNYYNAIHRQTSVVPQWSWTQAICFYQNWYIYRGNQRLRYFQRWGGFEALQGSPLSTKIIATVRIVEYLLVLWELVQLDPIMVPDFGSGEICTTSNFIWEVQKILTPVKNMVCK